MRHHMVRYSVKPERTAENEALIRAFYDELRRTQPVGLQHASFRLGDGAGFLHLLSLDTNDGHDPLFEVAAFNEFRETLDDRCDEPRVHTDLHEIGSFRLFAR